MNLTIWRHPKPRAALGRCIGARSDLAVDRRKAKRLAHRIRAQARRALWPRAVVCSPLARCAEVGRWLRRWGWRLRLDAGLLEFDFGRWDGQVWSAIGSAALDAWCADFAEHAPGGGESLAAFLQRVAGWQPGPEACAVGHGGWMRARLWLAEHGEGVHPLPAQWAQQTPGYGRALGFGLGGAAGASSSLAR